MRKELNRYPYPGFQDAADVAAADDNDDDDDDSGAHHIYTAFNLLRYRCGGTQIYKLLTEVGFVLLCLVQRRSLMKYCVVVCPLLLMKRDTARIMVRLDDMTLSLRRVMNLTSCEHYIFISGTSLYQEIKTFRG